MKRKNVPSFAVWVAIAGFVIVLLLSIIFVDQGKSISFWIPLIVAALNCGVTVLSRYETRRDQSALEERNTLPFLVLETVKIWENHENGNRFPWGGDPEPGGVYPIFLFDKVSPSQAFRKNVDKVWYLQAALYNIGNGIALNAKVSPAGDLESGRIVPFLVNHKTRIDQYYIQFESPVEMGGVSFSLLVEYESINGDSYSQEICCEIDIYDSAINGVVWYPSRPEKSKQKGRKKNSAHCATR